MLISIPDALIMAYADGELSGPLARRIREALPRDSGLRRKYEMFHVTRWVLPRTFSSVLDEPVPDRLTRTVTRRKKRLPG